MNIKDTIQTFSAVVTRLDSKIVRKTFTKDVQAFSARIMFENEVNALNKVKGISCFQQIVDFNYPHIDTLYCGIPLSSVNGDVPKDFCEQLENINQELDRVGIIHRDLIPRNFLIDRNKVTLIDFTWAYFHGCSFNNARHAPKGLGGRWNPRGKFQNSYSLEIIQQDLGTP